MSPEPSLEAPSFEKLPALLADGSFWGLMATQFLGAFNDNLFKQLVLFVCVKQALDGQAGNLQGLAMFVFALPFVLLSGVCGVLADRHSKRSIIVVSKVLEIVAMLLGALAFSTGSLAALLAVLSLMGAHSAFFGPAKYGILPELFRPNDLPRANGWMLMTLFFAIILGVALAGFLTVKLAGQLWLASTACIVTAILGTLAALLIRHTPVAHPGLPIRLDSFGIPNEARRLLRNQPMFLAVLMATSVFWCVGGIYQQGVNDLGILQLGIDAEKTSILGACAAIGIAVGCAAAGRLSQGRFEARLVILGQWGMLVCLTLLSLPGPMQGNTLLGIWGAGVVLVVLGASAGVFAVPLTVYLQALTPSGQKGQIIGVMNLVNWIGILASGLLHLGTSQFLAATQLPPNLIFLAGVALLIPLLVWYRPVSRELSIST